MSITDTDDEADIAARKDAFDSICDARDDIDDLGAG